MRSLTRFVAAALLVCGVGAAHAQSNFTALPTKYDSAATTNATVARALPSRLWTVVAINTTTTMYWLKFYNKATTPTCNSDTVVLKFPVPFGAANAGGGVVIPVPVGFEFTNGISFCLTGGAADNDNTAAATGVVINLGSR